MSPSEPRSVFIALVAKASGTILSPDIGSDELMQVIRGLTAVQMASFTKDVAASWSVLSQKMNIDYSVSDGDMEENEWSPVHMYLDIKKPIDDPELDALLSQLPSPFGPSDE